jgi:hypothetical protein
MTDFDITSDGASRVGIAISELVPIRTVVCSNLGRDNGYPGRCVLLLPSVPSGKFWDSSLVRPTLLPPKSFPIHISFIHSTLHFLATETSVGNP